MSLSGCVTYYSIVFILITSTTSANAEVSIGVLYPDIREPYLSIFTSITDGIKHDNGNKIHIHKIAESNDFDLDEWVNSNNIKILVALGIRSQRLVNKYEKVPVIVGGINRPPENSVATNGIMLAPNPDFVFGEVQRILPHIDTIFTVYNRKYSEWIINISKEIATKRGITLKAIPSDSIKSSVLHYKSIIENEKPGKYLIWLQQDPISSDKKVILPLLLDLAWNNNIPLISNNASHVNRGALLATYPDHYRMGKSLSRMASSLLNRATSEFIPLSDLFVAANVRTAEHLGLKWDRSIRDNFKLVFPNE